MKIEMRTRMIKKNQFDHNRVLCENRDENSNDLKKINLTTIEYYVKIEMRTQMLELI